MTSVPDDFEDGEFEEGVSPELAATSQANLSQDQIDERAHQLTRANNLGLQRVLLPEDATRGIAIEVASKRIPRNEYNLPVFFYRSDLLPHELGRLTNNDLDAAQVALSFDEGYPTYDDGKLFWFQLPHESFDDYMLFKRYLESAESVGIRQIQLFSMENNVSLKKVTELYKEYLWNERCKAYDLFAVAASRKQRELRSRNMEDRHFGLAQRLMEPLMRKFEEDQDFFSSLTPKEAVEVLRLLINIQRVSTGLAQNGNAGRQEHNPDAAKDAPELMREIAEGAGKRSEGVGLNNNLIALLANPDFASQAQALVIQVRHQEKAEEARIVKAVSDDD